MDPSCLRTGIRVERVKVYLLILLIQQQVLYLLRVTPFFVNFSHKYNNKFQGFSCFHWKCILVKIIFFFNLATGLPLVM